MKDTFLISLSLLFFYTLKGQESHFLFTLDYVEIHGTHSRMTGPLRTLPSWGGEVILCNRLNRLLELGIAMGHQGLGGWALDPEKGYQTTENIWNTLYEGPIYPNYQTRLGYLLLEGKVSATSWNSKFLTRMRLSLGAGLGVTISTTRANALLGEEPYNHGELSLAYASARDRAIGYPRLDGSRMAQQFYTNYMDGSYESPAFLTEIQWHPIISLRPSIRILLSRRFLLNFSYRMSVLPNSFLDGVNWKNDLRIIHSPSLGLSFMFLAVRRWWYHM